MVSGVNIFIGVVVVGGKVVVVASLSSVGGVVVAVVTVFVASSLSLFLIVVVVVGEVNFTSALGVVSWFDGAQRAGKLLRAVSLLLRGRKGSRVAKLSHILRISSVSCLRSCFCGGKPMGMYVAGLAAAVGPGGSWSFVVRSSGFATAVPL